MGRKKKAFPPRMGRKKKAPLLPLSGTRKVVRTPTNPFESVVTVEVFVPKEIIAREFKTSLQGQTKTEKLIIT